MVGAVLCLKGQPERAIPPLRRALEISPDFVAARKNLAIAEFETGEFEAAEENLRKLLGSGETRGQASLFLGMIASESGRHEEALRLLDDAGELASSQARAQISRARSLQRTGQAPAADGALDAVRARDDLTGADLLDIAQIAAAAGQYGEALADLDRATGLDSALTRVGERKVEILRAAGRNKDALALARQLADGKPRRALLSMLAALAEDAGDLDEAVIALRRAIQVEPEAEDGYIELGEFCVRHRNPELALEILDLGLRRMPDSYRLLVQKGITLGQGQRYEQARRAFAAAMELQPDHAVALTALAVSLILSEELEEALRMLQAGAERFPEDFYVHYIYGFALDRSRGGDEDVALLAQRQLRRSIELNPEFAPARYRLGKLLAERADREAMRHLEAAVRLDPELVSAKYQLGQLYVDAGRLEDGTRLMAEVAESKERQLDDERMPQFRVVRID